MIKGVWQLSAAVAASLLAVVAAAQQTAVIDFESVGRAWPLSEAITQGHAAAGGMPVNGSNTTAMTPAPEVISVVAGSGSGPTLMTAFQAA